MKRLGGYLLAVVAIAVLPFVVPNAYYIHVAQIFAYTAIAVIGLNILLGLSGQMSLGQSGFYALGTYGSAILATTYGMPLIFAMTVGLGLALLAGLLVGLVALRTRGLHLAMATLAFGFIVEILAQRWGSLTGGTMGLMGVPQIDYGNFRMGPIFFFWTAAGVLLLVQIASDYIFASSIGRRLRALKESEAFASTIGLNVAVWRILVFAGSAVLAGVAGVLFAHHDGFVSSDAFNIRLTIGLLIAAVIGGLGRTYGPLFGTAILIGIAETIASLHDIGQLLYGAILLGVLILFPEGAIGLLNRILSLGRKTMPPVNDGPQVLAQPIAYAPKRLMLSVQDVTKMYAGVTALKDVTLSVEPGTIHALIGPNGAGKSTFINIVAGLYRPSAGRICLDGRDVTQLSAHRRARMGVVRTFQNLQLVNGVDVLSNVMLGMAMRRSWPRDVADWLLGRDHEGAEHREALAILASLGLHQSAHLFPPNLSYGHRKLVELGRAMAQKPSVLLLDEPVAGLNPEEAQEIATVVKRLRDSGVTVLIVEHNMEFVMGISDTVTVLDFGNCIAVGKPEAVQREPAVIRAYLGTASVSP